MTTNRTAKIKICEHCQQPIDGRAISVAYKRFHPACFRIWNVAAIASRKAELAAALAPESNTEAAQQCAAEMEQAPHWAHCTCPECCTEPSAVYLARYNAIKDEPFCITTGQQQQAYWTKYRKALARETSQPDFFAARVDDLPLFSGTAPRGQAQTFDPPAADSHRQAKLF